MQPIIMPNKQGQVMMKQVMTNAELLKAPADTFNTLLADYIKREWQPVGDAKQAQDGEFFLLMVKVGLKQEF